MQQPKARMVQHMRSVHSTSSTRVLPEYSGTTQVPQKYTSTTEVHEHYKCTTLLNFVTRQT